MKQALKAVLTTATLAATEVFVKTLVKSLDDNKVFGKKSEQEKEIA